MLYDTWLASVAGHYVMCLKLKRRSTGSNALYPFTTKSVLSARAFNPSDIVNVTYMKPLVSCVITSITGNIRTT